MNTPGRIKFSQLPVLSEVDDSDEVLFRDVDGEDPAQQVGRLSIATLRAAMGGGADDWSEHAATQDVDLDGHKITGLGAPTEEDDAATKGYVDARPGADAWSEHAATQDVDLDGFKITGLGEPTDAADAATKGYVDAASPTKIERTFAWGRSVAEVADNGDIELAVYLTGQEVPRRRVRVPRGELGDITLENRNLGYLSSLKIEQGPSYGINYELSGGSSASMRCGFRSFNGRFHFWEAGGAQKYLSDATYPLLPAGVQSYAHAAHLAKQAHDRLPDLEWWEPTWTPVENVDSVSNVECQYTRTYRAAGGSLVTLEGTIDVTPDAAGLCEVRVDLPIARVGADFIVGVAAFTDGDDSGIASVGIADLGTGQQLAVQFTHDTDAVHRVSFRISYRAA